MKTIFILFTMLLGMNLLIAQPVVTSDILLNIGDERKVYYVETEFNPGDAGENITWDFSDLTPMYDVLWVAEDPADTGLDEYFPTADLAFMIPGDDSQESYTDGWIFYNTGEGDEISLLGAILFNITGSNVDTNYFMLNEDPDLLFEFPMTYPDQFMDSVHGTNLVVFQNQQFEVDRSGNTTTEVDGYGTLITPEGTFNNVIRVKRTEDLVDLFATIPTFHEIVRYDWYSPDYDYLLYHTENIIIRDAVGNEQSTSAQTYYAEPNPITGIYGKEVETFSVHPNPCDEVIFLPADKVKNSTKVELFNMHGRNVYSDWKQSEKIDVSLFQPGVYVVVITGMNGEYYCSQVIVI